jgi:phosphoribosylformylglycinamidine (FGAM) synthase PurS component
MKTVGVRPSEWTSFFDAFSRRHQGWLVKLTVLDSRLGAQVVALELPLQGVVADPRGRNISIQLGELPDDVGHDVRNAKRVWVELGDDDSEAAVEIESADGTKAILEFRSAILPEMVDGLAPGPPSGTPGPR